MSIEAELRVNRRNTLAFIAARPIALALIPQQRTKTSSGGFRYEDLPLRAEQTLRLIEQASAYGNSPGLLQASDGKQRRVQYQLLGPYDAEIGLYDYWVSAGLRFEVAELMPYNGYERRGQVIQYGG
jgi:hypothetical protein